MCGFTLPKVLGKILFLLGLVFEILLGRVFGKKALDGKSGLWGGGAFEGHCFGNP